MNEQPIDDLNYDPFASEAGYDLDADYDPFNPDAIPAETRQQLAAPLIMSRRIAKRESLARLITRLPDPDELIYVVGNGTGREKRMGAVLDAYGFDYGSFVPVLADMLGVGSVLYISTWVMNRDTATEFIRMLDDGRLSELYLLTDPFFKSKPSTAPIANTLMLQMPKYAPRARFLAFQNHTKILCMRDAANARFVTITGSSNLTAVQRCEQYVLDGSPDTYRFFVDQFFNPMLQKADR